MVGNMIIIGASTGGPRALKTIFGGLPRLNAAVLLVQHMPRFINESFCRSLGEVTDMDVMLASDGCCLEAGKVCVAPGEVHTVLVSDRVLRLANGEKVCFVRPSIDVTMKSVKRGVSGRLAGVIMTGMGRDGADGITHLKNLGATILAQDKQTCAVWGMPQAAVSTGNVDFVQTPKGIAKQLIELVGVAN